MKTGHQCKTNHTVLRIRREDCQALQVRILPVPQIIIIINMKKKNIRKNRQFINKKAVNTMVESFHDNLEALNGSFKQFVNVKHSQVTAIITPA